MTPFGQTLVRTTTIPHHTECGPATTAHNARLRTSCTSASSPKSRARPCNDNALVEGKNGAVIRSYLGYEHIPQRFAPQVNAFTQAVLSLSI